LRRRLNAGGLAGPRLLVSGEIVRVNQTPDEARAVVQRLAAAQVDVVKSVYNATPDGAARKTLEAIVDEAHKHGLETMIHAISAPETLTAVQVGVDRLVHTPHTGALDRETAGIVAAAGIPMTSTLGVFAPLFDENNSPRWRDGTPFPEGGIQRAGQGPANGRLLFEAGVVYGFGTDTRFAPRDSLAHELKPLTLLFSPRDIVMILTTNAAAYMRLDTEIGTLEAGKVGDLVIIDGDPLADINDVLNVEAVIKGGKVVAAHVSDHNDFLARDIERAQRQ
jgi:imidazolonepropionase-like amidohydrolase